MIDQEGLLAGLATDGETAQLQRETGMGWGGERQRGREGRAETSESRGPGLPKSSLTPTFLLASPV